MLPREGAIERPTMAACEGALPMHGILHEVSVVPVYTCSTITRRWRALETHSIMLYSLVAVGHAVFPCAMFFILAKLPVICRAIAPQVDALSVLEAQSPPTLIPIEGTRIRAIHRLTRAPRQDTRTGCRFESSSIPRHACTLSATGLRMYHRLDPCMCQIQTHTRPPALSSGSPCGVLVSSLSCDD